MASFTHQAAGHTLVAATTYAGNGAYRGALNLTEGRVSAWGVRVLVGTQRLTQAHVHPTSIVVTPGAIATARCTAAGSALAAGVTGRPTTVTLMARDQFDNVVSGAAASFAVTVPRR